MKQDIDSIQMINETYAVKVTVSPEMLASFMGSGTLDVLSTPYLIALMENAATQLAQNYIDEDCTTVGTMINIMHTAPTPLNAEIRAEATLTKIDGRFFYFDVAAFDELGEIANGKHERCSVKSQKFQEKANSKIEK